MTTDDPVHKHTTISTRHAPFSLLLGAARRKRRYRAAHKTTSTSTPNTVPVAPTRLDGGPEAEGRMALSSKV